MTDATTIRAFLDDDHIERLAEIDAFVQAEIAPLSEPADDDAARQQAREVLRSMGEAGWYGAIEAGDLRGCCLVREAVAWGSPLADAVFALQGLGSTPIALAGSSEMKDTWFAPAMVGSKMAAFAMTEPNAGQSTLVAATLAAPRLAGGMVWPVWMKCVPLWSFCGCVTVRMVA